ncbi:hypothetical protein B0H34DRAFT_520184 [Crassisporium funariophilum]|nr:hypothetical protein B0H34DRAFT_520184 [Crassisporium funariophilum]
MAFPELPGGSNVSITGCTIMIISGSTVICDGCEWKTNTDSFNATGNSMVDSFNRNPQNHYDRNTQAREYSYDSTLSEDLTPRMPHPHPHPLLLLHLLIGRFHHSIRI